MHPQRPPLTLAMEQLADQVCEDSMIPCSRPGGICGIRVSSPQNREPFRIRLKEVLRKLAVPDSRHDVSMREFLKWRIQVLWFLHQHFGGDHPYRVEFLLTVEREADPRSNGIFMVAAQAIREAVQSYLNDSFMILEEERR